MNRRKRIIYTAEQRALIWDRYQQGDSLAYNNWQLPQLRLRLPYCECLG